MVLLDDLALMRLVHSVHLLPLDALLVILKLGEVGSWEWNTTMLLLLHMSCLLVHDFAYLAWHDESLLLVDGRGSVVLVKSLRLVDDMSLCLLVAHGLGSLGKKKLLILLLCHGCSMGLSGKKLDLLVLLTADSGGGESQLACWLQQILSGRALLALTKA